MITDQHRNIWLQGINAESKLVSDDSLVNPRPFITPHMLRPTETIIHVHHTIDLLCIYTSLKCLFIFRVLQRDILADLNTDLPLNQNLRNIDFGLEPFEGVTDIAFMGSTVMFHCDYGHCIFNHDMVLVGNTNEKYHVPYGIVCEPVVRDHALRCYRVVLAIDSTVFYHQNFVHAYSDHNHTVFSAPGCDLDALSVVQFCDDGTPPSLLPEKSVSSEIDGLQPVQEVLWPALLASPLLTLAQATQSQIYVNAHNPTFVVMIEGMAYHNQGPTKPLKPWSKFCGYARIVNEGNPDQRLIFVKDKRVRNLQPSIEAAVPVSEIKGTDGTGILVVDNDLPDLCTPGLDVTYINAKYLEWWRICKMGIIAYSSELKAILFFTTRSVYKSSLITVLSETTTGDDQTLVVLKIETPEHVIDAWTGESMVCCKVSGNRYYKIEITEVDDIVLISCWELVLDLCNSITYPFLISHHHALKPSHQLPICIDSNDDLLVALSTSTVIFPYPNRPELVYDLAQEDMTLIIIEQAMSLFAKTYLIQHGMGFILNASALCNIGPDLDFSTEVIHRLGSLVHMAVILGSRLPFSPSLSVLVGLKGREPTLTELEYFVAKYFTEIPEQIRDMRDMHLDLENGDSYRDCLMDILQYDPDYSSIDSALGRLIAQGIVDYTMIPNLDCMNLLTIDLYFTRASTDPDAHTRTADCSLIL